MDVFEFHPVTTERWPDLAEFFQQNGNPNYCWCMRWRLKSSDFAADDSAGRRSKLERLVHQNRPVGVLAYVEGYPVEPDKSYRFMGSPAVFERVGFEEAGTGKNGRKIVRLGNTKQP